MRRTRMRSGTRAPEGCPTASILAATVATEGDCMMPPKLMWPVSPRCCGRRGCDCGCGGGVSRSGAGIGAGRGLAFEGAERASAPSSGCSEPGASMEFAFCIVSWDPSALHEKSVAGLNLA